MEEGTVLGHTAEIEVHTGLEDRVVYSPGNRRIKWIETTPNEFGPAHMHATYIYRPANAASGLKEKFEVAPTRGTEFADGSDPTKKR